MPGADPISAAILGVVGGVANIWGAKKAADAAKKAAELQIAATKKGQLYADQAHGDQRSLMDPYVQAGRLSLADLQSRLYGGSKESYMPQQPAPTSGPQMSGDARAIADAYQLNLGRPASLKEIQDRLADPKFDVLRHVASVAQAPEAKAYAARQAAGGASAQAPMSLAAMQGQQPPQEPPAPPQGFGGLVRVQAPTGEMAQFPEGSPGLQDALTKGARRL